MDFSRYSQEFYQTFQDVSREVEDRDHTTVTAEHLLFAIMNDPLADMLFKNAGVNKTLIEVRLEHFFEDQKEMLTDPANLGKEGEPSASIEAKRILHRAYTAATSANSEREIDALDALVAFYGERDCEASRILLGVMSRLDLMGEIKKLGPARWTLDEDDIKLHQNLPAVAAQQESSDDSKEKKKQPPLEQFCIDLLEKARAGKIDPLVGRGEEVERTVEILSRRKKNNPLLVGDPGVGKTAIAEGLARKIVLGDVPKIMENDVIYALDMGALIAGTKYRGDFESRIKELLADVKKMQKRLEREHKQDFGHEDTIRPPKVHLFIDEIHTLIGAGKAGGSADAANLLKPALASGELSCIGATTYKEFRNIMNKDKALTRRFQKIDVKEPTVDETYRILQGLRTEYEAEHRVLYTDDALKKAAVLAARYINDRNLPDSAIDVIDEAGASRKVRSESGREITKITAEDVSATVAKIARIPPAQVSDDDKSSLKGLEDRMKGVVFGQDKAVEEVTQAVKMARAGLHDPQKPIGCYMFEGPTGVGKTEVAKQLAEQLGLKFTRIDMSEYMEKHAVARLIGAPPGYVGFDQGGLLTEAVDQNPYSVVLMDEIEKAHPDIYNILLQVMDHGTLTDNNGKNVKFGNVILIMTTNAGAAEKAKEPIGFWRDRESENKGENEAITKMFTPEFRNRLDAIVPFDSLKPEHTGKIVDKFIKQLDLQLAEQDIRITLSDKAREWLAKEGYDKAMGARPMARAIQEYVKKPLTDEILFGELANGGTVHIVFNEESGASNDNSPQAAAKPLSFLYNKAADANDTKALPSPDMIQEPPKDGSINGPK